MIRPAQTGKQPTVLITDDEIHMRLLVDRCLKRIGVKTVLASRGDEAVEKLKQGGIDLVILDYEMPVMNGVTALREIRELDGGRQVKAVMITARGNFDLRAETAALDVDAYFAKPFSPVELARRVSELLHMTRDKS